MQPDIDPQSHGIVVLFSACLATVAALLGYETIACNGILAGALSTLMLAGFLVVVHTGTLLGCLALLALFAGIAHWLARSSVFRTRKGLVTFILPVSALLGGVAVGRFADIGLECALHPWA